MPTPNYSNSCIYKLCCKDTSITDIYVGSTTNFRNRRYQHKCCVNNINGLEYNNFKYKFIRENGGWDNWDMILIEYFNCNTKLELHKKEREYIEILKSTLNKELPSRTVKEYAELNIEKKKLQLRNYYNNNKLKYKIYRDANKDKQKEYLKKYREANKDKQREYYERYKERKKNSV
tara:strand:+ start:89 stop:616 length:528 start_codon:yes stop_codon:yes gene_type:complete